MPEEHFTPDNLDPKKNGDEKSTAHEPEPIREHWTEIHKRWRKEEDVEALSQIKKLALLTGTCILGVSSFLYYRHKESVEAEKAADENQIPSYIEYASKASNLNDQEKKKLEQFLKQIKELFPKGAVQALEKRSRENDTLRPAIPTKPAVSGFESVGIDTKDVSALFDDKYFPKGFWNGNIRKVVYKNEVRHMGPGTVGAQVDRTNSIEFLRPSFAFFNDKQDQRPIWFLTIHEAAHANDWRAKLNIKPEDRPTFQLQAATVYKNHQRFVATHSGTSSPEKTAALRVIERKGGNDKKILFDLSLTEWWAQLVEGYMESPRLFAATASEEEKKLIEDWLLREDKKFDNSAVYEQRRKAWSEVKAVVYSKLAKKGLDADAGFRKPRLRGVEGKQR
ncbi:MAG: hypothetical protein Q8R08_03195 [bacterium]|nr:hypothetical protein [bacterium]